MKARLLRRLLLFALWVVASPARSEQPQGSVAIGNAQVSLGMSRGAARVALQANKNHLITRMGGSQLVVTDAPTMQAVAILTFDRNGRLSRVEKNWTPASLPPEAETFAIALYDLAEQMTPRDTGDGQRPCTLSVSRRSPVGPHAWLRDPGKPDLDVREVRLSCGDQAIQIYVYRPSDATKVLAPMFGIRRVLLYQSTGDSSR